MESLFIAQLVGIYLLVVGVIVSIRRKSIMPAISDLAKSRALIVTIAFIELAAGIAVVLVYPRVSFDWMGLVSLVGWMMVIESVFYLSMPLATMQKFIRQFNRPQWYVTGGLASVALGAYLTAIGFGIL